MESATSQDKSKLHQPHVNKAHLLTPESPLLDSFSQSVPITQQAQAFVPSPPASPSFDNQFQKGYDQQLYPESNSHNDTILPPLFNEHGQNGWASRQQTPPTERSLSIATPQAANISPIASNAQSFSHTEPRTPSKKFVNPVGPVALYNHYGNEYYQFMLAQMEDHRSQMRNRTLPVPEAPRGSDRNVYDRTVLRSLDRHRVEKPRTLTRVAPKPRQTRPTSSRGVPAIKTPVLTHAVIATPTKRERTPARRAPRRTTTPDAAGGAPVASKRTRAAPSKKLDGKAPSQWAELEDYCPAISSLDKPGVELTAQWNNNSALNLDNDVDRIHLHPQELKIASRLRLHCNEYLLNKRRIFAAKLKSLQDNTVFNKTSAQNATSVDVNKASRLWSAFDGAGWFDPSWFEEWL